MTRMVSTRVRASSTAHEVPCADEQFNVRTISPSRESTLTPFLGRKAISHRPEYVHPSRR